MWTHHASIFDWSRNLTICMALRRGRSLTGMLALFWTETDKGIKSIKSHCVRPGLCAIWISPHNFIRPIFYRSLYRSQCKEDVRTSFIFPWCTIFYSRNKPKEHWVKLLWLVLFLKVLTWDLTDQWNDRATNAPICKVSFILWRK